MIRIFIIMTLIFVSILYSQWEELGPWTTRVDDISISVDASDNIHVFIADQTSIPYKNINLENWFNLDDDINELTNYPLAIASVPDNPDIIYIGRPTYSPAPGYFYPAEGLYVSYNGGITWDERNGNGANLINNQEISFITIDQNNPNRMFIGCLIDFTTGEFVYRTMDGGGNWEALQLTNSEILNVSSIQFDPLDPNIIFATAGFPHFSNAAYSKYSEEILRTEGHGVYKSIDGGTTWELKLSLSPQLLVGKIQIDPINNDILYVPSPEHGIYKSIDNGENWNLLADSPLYCNTVEINNINPSILYAGTDGLGIFKNTNFGVGGWTTINNGIIVKNINSLESSSVQPDMIFAGTEHTLYYTTDGGVVWNETNIGAKFSTTFDLEYAFDNKIITNPSRIFVKEKHANEEWETIYFNSGAFAVFDLSLRKTNSSEIYLTFETGLGIGSCLRTLDSGENWEEIRLRNNIYGNSIIVHELNPVQSDIMYLLSPYSSPNNDLYQFEYSENFGDNWTGTDINVNQFNKNVYTIEIDPINPSNMYIGLNSGLICDNPLQIQCENDEMGIYKSENGGYSWTHIQDGFSDDWINCIAVNPFNNQEVHSGNYNGLHFSSDFGSTWQPVFSLGWNITSLKYHPLIPDLLYASGKSNPTQSNLIKRSFDGGITWSSIAENSDILIRDIEISREIPSSIYISSSEGIRKFTENSEEFVIENNLTWQNVVYLNTDLTITNNSSLTINEDTNIICTNDVTISVDSGASLILNEGVTFLMDSGTNFDISGNLIINGTLENQVEFFAIETNWQGIQTYLGSNLELDNLVIQDAIRLDFDNLTNSSLIQNSTFLNTTLYSLNGNPTFNECVFDNNSVAMWINSNTTPISTHTISNCTFLNNYIGLVVTGHSSPNISSSEFKDNTVGLFVVDYSNPYLFQNNVLLDESNNSFHNNSSYGVYAASWGRPWLGIYSPGLQMFEGRNRLFDNGVYDIINWSGPSFPIKSEMNHWQNDPQDPCFSGIASVPGDGSVDWEPTLYDIYQGCGGLPRGDQNLSMLSGLSNEQIITELFDEPNSEFTHSLIAILVHNLELSNDFDELAVYLNELSDISNTLTEKYAKSSLISQNILFGNYFSSSEMLNDFEQYYGVTDLTPQHLYEQAIIEDYQNGGLGKNTSQSNTYFNELEKEFPDSGYGILASIINNNPININDDYNENIMIENPFPTQFKLYSAFPNPFNPVTNLSYSIPENGNVSLIVYDMLGQEVTELVNTHKDAGYHSVQWDATSPSSGIYIVKLVAGNFTQTHKIALVK